jgi:uncharacterized RDD family membrane protein YckC
MNGLKLGKGKAFIAQASVLKRIAAFIIDLLIINLIILFPFKRIFNNIVPDTGSISETVDFLSSNTAYNMFITLLMLLIAVLAILYFVILEKRLQQSPGKMLFNLYVKSKTKDLKYWQLFVRSMFLIPVFPFVLLWIIDPVVMLFTKENQRLSEILSRTKVVEKYKV